MKKRIRIAGLISLVALCSVMIACKGDPFIGTWKPAPTSDNDLMKIDSFNINKDGTFSMKAKDSARKEVTGTWTKTGETIELKGPDLKQKVEASIESDGRLKITEGGRSPVFFVKA